MDREHQRKEGSMDGEHLPVLPEDKMILHQQQEVWKELAWVTSSVFLGSVQIGENSGKFLH